MMHTNPSVLSTEDVLGANAFGADSAEIGEIDHVIIDKASGRVIYAMISFGGFPGLGQSHYPVPWGALKYEEELDGFRTSITETLLKDATELAGDLWAGREWEIRIHNHYGVQPYWA